MYYRERTAQHKQKMSKTEMTPEERDAKEQEEFNTGPLRYRTGGFGSMGRKRCCFEAAVW